MNEPGAVNNRIPSPLAGQTFASEDDYRQYLEEQRRTAVQKRRSYYLGSMNDTDNAWCLAELGTEGSRTGEKSLARWIYDRKLPEHYRLHAYCTVIEDSVDFLTHRLCRDFAIEAKNAAVQAILGRCLDSSPELSGTADDDEVSVVNVTREALLASDCPVRVRFDPALGTTWLEFWHSDSVRMDFTRERSDRPEVVKVWETHWSTDEAGTSHQVTVRREWRVEWYFYPGPDGTPDAGPSTYQCVESWWEERPGGEDELLGRTPTGLPFLPWGLLRGSRRGLRIERGESIVTDRAMYSVDRYDALMQHEWLAARHNSHANLGVVGDQAMIAQNAGRHTLGKDVADVLSFPGGTALVPIVLPTDTSLIVDQRTVLLDALYGTFGLARVDQTTLQGLGQVTGYALEILNTKTDSTFDALRQQLVRDWLALANTIIDAHAHWSAGATNPDPIAATVAGLEVDPAVTYPDRSIEIRTGTGGVVDVARIREDFLAGLISRREAWRQLGYTEEEIKKMEADLREEAQLRADIARITAATAVEGGTFGNPQPPGSFGTSGGQLSGAPQGRPGGVLNGTNANTGRGQA